MSILFMLAMTGTADAIQFDELIRCRFVDGALECDPPLRNPTGEPSDGIVEIKTSDAEADSTHPTAVYAMLEGSEDWSLYTQLKIDGEFTLFVPSIINVPEVGDHILDEDVDGDGTLDIQVEIDGVLFGWFGGSEEVREFDSYDFNN